MKAPGCISREHTSNKRNAVSTLKGIKVVAGELPSGESVCVFMPFGYVPTLPFLDVCPLKYKQGPSKGRLATNADRLAAS